MCGCTIFNIELNKASDSGVMPMEGNKENYY